MVLLAAASASAALASAPSADAAPGCRALRPPEERQRECAAPEQDSEELQDERPADLPAESRQDAALTEHQRLEAAVQTVSAERAGADAAVEAAGCPERVARSGCLEALTEWKVHPEMAP